MRFPLSSTLVAILLIQFAPLSRAADPLRTIIPVVVSVEADKITVQNGIHKGMKVTETESYKIKSKDVNLKTYTVNKFTEISINGHVVKLADIKPGMQVRVTQTTDPTVAARIVAKVDPSVLMPVNP